MKFVPFNPDFDPKELSPFEALKATISDTGARHDGELASTGALAGCARTGHLVLINCNKQEARHALEALKPRHLVVSCPAIETLDFLEFVDDLRSLVLQDMPKITSLAPLSRHTELTSLLVEDCSRCTEIKALADLKNLSMVRLSGADLGGGWKRIDLSPIAGLAKLRHLSLAGLRTPDESLECLARLPKLDDLEIDGGWPARELARMAALQPHLTSRSTFLKPLVASAETRTSGFHDVDPQAYPADCIRYMVSGKRGAYGLRPGDDDRKIARAKARWNAWIIEFRELYNSH